MPIPIDILLAVKDLLRRPPSDTLVDEELDGHYIDVLKDLAVRLDWIVEKSLIDITAGQRTYLTPPRMTRLLAVLYNNTHIQKVSARSLDYLRAGWQAGGGSDANGAPEVFWLNQLPDATVVPNEFGVHPTPDSTTINGFTTYQVTRPANDIPTPLWIKPLLIYHTAARYLTDAHAHRDGQVGAFYRTVADMWEHALSSRIP